MAWLARIVPKALVALAVISVAAPVSAQPLRITVTEPGLIEPAPPLVPSGRLVRPSTLFDYQLDFESNFDPGKAAADSQFFSRPTPALNMMRAAVIESTGESIAEHQLRCQALFSTYEPVSDTYLDEDGIPRDCFY